MNQDYRSLLWFGAALVLLGFALAPATAQAQRGAPNPTTHPEQYEAWKLSLPPAQPPPSPPMPALPPVGALSGGGLLIPYPGDGGWTELPPNDDGSSGLVPLGFDFEFYGTAYSDVCVNNNGNVSFLDCFSTFTATGFPSDFFTMVAPFWADVDTRCVDCGLVYYKQATFNGAPVFVAHWEAVGYFSASSDKLNTFQAVIADTAVLPGGNNVCLGYGDMQWTTGSASGGDGGFGGEPATVGANAGDGIDYFLIGRFDHEGTDYDGPGGEPDGVSFLDDAQYCFNTGAGTSNVPPVASGFSDGDTFTVEVGQTFERAFSFLSPEIGQTTEVSVDDGGLGSTFSWEATPGNPAVVDVTFTPAAGQAGEHEITLSATDDGAPPLTTVASIRFVVPGGANQAPDANDDTAETDAGVPVRIDVLANDTDLDDDPLSISSVGTPDNGAAAVVDGQVEYTPAPDFSGTDAFTYTISDGQGGSDEATVTVTVNDASVMVNVEAEPEVGGEAGVEVTVTGFTPSEAELFYRVGGARSFASVPLALSGGTYSADIPAEAVTLRGIDYYVVLSDGETTVTFPTSSPEESPAHLRVAVDVAVSEAPPPPDGTYRMVSVPVALADASPAAVFEDDYGAYDPSVWRLLRWQPGQERYAELPGLETAVTPGTAFWLASRVEAAFDVEDGLSVDASSPVTMTLQPGYNQIAAPFAFPIAWEGVGGSEGVRMPVAWDGAEYVFEQEVLAPWEGYFVENTTGAPVELTFFPDAAAAAGALASARGAAVAYQLRLRAVADGAAAPLRDTHNYLGFAEGAADGLDALDWGEPPPPGAHLRLSVVEEGHRLARSIRAAGGEGAAWEVEVTASPTLLSPEPLEVRLRLHDVGERPAGHGLWVLDLDRTAALPLGGERAVLTLTPEAPVRRLRVIVGTEAFAQTASQGLPLVPLDYALLPAYPNPAHGTAVIPYQLAERGPVTLEVYDALGRRVAVLVDAEQDGGRHEAAWAADVASGVYVYRLQAGSFVETGKLSILRSR